MAQLNRASDYGSEGYRFESCRGHSKKEMFEHLFFCGSSGILNDDICPVIKDPFEFRANTSWAEMRFRNPYQFSSKETPSSYNASVFGLIEERLNLIPPGMLTYTNLFGAQTTPL